MTIDATHYDKMRSTKLPMLPPNLAPILEQRMAPDRQGNDINLDATWTKIDRSLVSTELLERKGVRYEARPDFVAVLGVLRKATVIEWARLSAEIRASRKIPGETDAAKRVGNDGAGHSQSTVEGHADKARGIESKDQREEQEGNPWDSDLAVWGSELEAWDLGSEAGDADLDSGRDGDDGVDNRPDGRAQHAREIKGRRTSHSGKDWDRDRDPDRGFDELTTMTGPSRQINTNVAPPASSATSSATTSTRITATAGNDSFSSFPQKLRLYRKRMALLNTLRAVGLGTAAASLMDVLVEASLEVRVEGISPPS